MSTWKTVTSSFKKKRVTPVCVL